MRVSIGALQIPAGDDAALEALVVAPVGEGRHPGVLFYTDIFGRNPASVRMMARFAGYGLTVVAPDLYRRIEPAGVALDFTAEYDRAQRDASATPVEAFDADRRLTLEAMRAHPRVAEGRLAAVGFCIGGHLALRAAVEPGMEAIVAYYPTGVHDGTLGASRDVATLATLAKAPGRLLLVFGASDPHVALESRARIADALGVAPGSGTPSRRISAYDGEHAFLRDEGPRYDSRSADAAFAEGIAWLDAGA